MEQLIQKIIELVKKRDDYDSAADLMIQNDLSIDALSKKTFKLSQIDLAKLADKILQKK